jgi:hypothetical protein
LLSLLTPTPNPPIYQLPLPFEEYKRNLAVIDCRKAAFATPPSPTLTHFIPGVSAGHASGIKACCENLPSGIVSGKNLIVGLMRALGGE